MRDWVAFILFALLGLIISGFGVFLTLTAPFAGILALTMVPLSVPAVILGGYLATWAWRYYLRISKPDRGPYTGKNWGVIVAFSYLALCFGFWGVLFLAYKIENSNQFGINLDLSFSMTLLIPATLFAFAAWLVFKRKSAPELLMKLPMNIHIRNAFANLGKERVRLDPLYLEFHKLASQAHDGVVPSPVGLRLHLSAHSSDSDQYVVGKPDLYTMPEGSEADVFGIRANDESEKP